MRKIDVVVMALSFLAIVSIPPISVIGDGNPVICKVSSFSNDKPLPFEPIGVLAILQNMTDEERKIEDGDTGALQVRVQYPGGRIEESASTSLAEPARAFFIVLLPKGSRGSDDVLNYLKNPPNDFQKEMIHAFPEPGMKVMIEGRIADIASGFEASVDVQSLSGRDRAAYDFLKTTELPKGFYFPSGNMPDLPDNQENLALMQKFADDYRDTRYANLARLGLGLLYQRIAEPVFDKYPEDADKNRKRAIHTFKALIKEWKEAKGEKEDRDDGDDDGEEDHDNGRKKADVEKHIMFWASTYLGQIYEEWGFETLKIGTTITPDKENMRRELYKKALKVYEYALAQEPNEYWKFVLQPLADEVKKKIVQNEESKDKE